MAHAAKGSVSLSPRAEILPTDSPGALAVALRRAGELLERGEVVAVPTETVYGLAANALNAEAVARIFEIKGRPAHNPIIVHVSSLGMAQGCVREWPAPASRLARAFWPGPLTLVLPRAQAIPPVVTAGGPTVGVRWPSHPFVQQLISQCGFPLAAPSANLSSRVSPTTAEHVQRQLGNRISLIIDGGRSQVGIESTVLDLSGSAPRLLRPGMIHEQALRAVIGEMVVGPAGTERVLSSPGLLKKHYAPRARLVVWSWRDAADLSGQCAAAGIRPESAAIIAHSRVPAGGNFRRVAVIPHDAEAFARALYAELHECDQAGAELIVVESLPKENRWRALADRLRRAAA